MITVRGLKKRYGRKLALDGIDLQIDAGDVLCVLGPNGAGKTTLLSLIAGALYPSAGELQVFGLDRWKSNYDIRARSVFVPAMPMISSKSPYEHLRFVSQIYGLPEAQFHERLEKLSREMQYDPELGREWSKLSPGLQKKAALIAAFLPDVELRILDEPFSGGIDPLGMEVLYRWIAAAADRRETIIFSTQVLEQAENVANRIALLGNGKLLEVGSPAELIAKSGHSIDEPRALSKAYLALTAGEPPRE